MLTYSSAGHPTAYLLDDSGAVKQLLSSTSMPLGIAEDAEFSAATPLEMAVGDRLLLFTDGALDASAPDGAHFGIGRVMALVCQNLHCSSTDLVEIICQAVNHFSHGDPRKDDVTIVIMRRETPG
jgi:sigma-B regulation protein RsbU (phosphoserine phosphatase)